MKRNEIEKLNWKKYHKCGAQESGKNPLIIQQHRRANERKYTYGTRLSNVSHRGKRASWEGNIAVR
jgi:hypothetical protein